MTTYNICHHSPKVAEMRSLYQSLEEVCVKDMLEGDNKYTCSQCGTKVSLKHYDDDDNEDGDDDEGGNKYVCDTSCLHIFHSAPFQISVPHDSSFIKVRAEKRACFKSLPDILAFNTMRYSFNMVTMMKEKVNVNLIVLIVTTIINIKTML